MKITIEIDNNEVQGIMDYLMEINGTNKRPTKADIQAELQGIITATLQNPHEAVSDYIKKYRDETS